MRCASSIILSGINTLRNPDGWERNWSDSIEYASIFNRYRSQTAKLREVQFIKSVVGQVASLVIVPIAIVETIAYTVLTVISLVFYRYTHKPYTFSMNLLKSSSFLIIWVFSKIEYCWLISIREEPLGWLRSNRERQRRLAILLVINAVIATTSFFLGSICSATSPLMNHLLGKGSAPIGFFERKIKQKSFDNTYQMQQIILSNIVYKTIQFGEI